MNSPIPTVPITGSATAHVSETVIREKNVAQIPLTTVSENHLITNGTTNGAFHGNYPIVTFRPLEAKFVHDKDPIGKMDPYCKFKIGWHTGKSSVAKSEGTHPIWSGDAITLKRKHNEEFAKIKLKDKDRLTPDDKLGEVKIRLDDIAAKGKMTQWFTLEKRGKMTGEVLLDIEYHNVARNAPRNGITEKVAINTVSNHHFTSGTTNAAYPAANVNHHTHTTATPNGVFKGNYPTITFRPLEAEFVHDKDSIGKMDPYCKFKIGWHSGKSSIAKDQGIHPVWAGEAITLKRKHNEEFAKIKLKDKDRATPDDRLGKVKIRLDDIAAKGKVTEWFPLEKRGKMTGQVLLEIEYHSNAIRTGTTPEMNTVNFPLATITEHSLHTNGALTAAHTVMPTSNHHVNNRNVDFASVLFRPLEAKFYQDKDNVKKMDPYCKVKIGWHSGKSTVAKNEGVNPIWVGETIVLLRKHNEEFAKIKLKDKDRLTFDDRLGEVKIRLDEIAAKGKVTQWFVLEKAGRISGEVLLDIEYHHKPLLH